MRCLLVRVTQRVCAEQAEGDCGRRGEAVVSLVTPAAVGDSGSAGGRRETGGEGLCSVTGVQQDGQREGGGLAEGHGHRRGSRSGGARARRCVFVRSQQSRHR